MLEQQLEETRQSVRELQNELTQTVTEPNTVLFSNFYVGDETGEVGMTSSGLTVNDFYPNEQGYLMYNGKVVIAAAHDVLGQVQEGYETHELYDELVISINGSDYEAIVLDVCGACMGGYGEDYQRYDIMTVGSVIGLKVGYVYKEDNQNEI